MTIARLRNRPGPELLSVLMLGAGAAVAIYAVPHLVVLRSALGLPFLLLGQGYLLSRAMFGRGQIEPSARLTLSLAFSIAATVLAALALDLVGIGITTRSLVVALVAVGFLAAVAALVRDSGGSGQTGQGRVRLAPETVRWVLGLGGGAVIFAIALVALARPLPNTMVAGYTQLWALRGSDGRITVGVRSAEHQPQRYRVVAQAASGANSSYTVDLPPGRTTIRALRVAGPPLQIVNVRLYRQPNLSGPRNPRAAAYRSVSLRP